MGSWGTGVFENDTALDWQDEFLTSTPRPAKLKGCFNRLLKHPHSDADLESEALAAAEVLSGLRGHPCADLPDQLADWVSASRGKLQEEWQSLAQQAVQRVITESELKELWQDSELFDQWQTETADLLTRLAKPKAPKAKRPKGPKIWLRKKNSGATSFTYLAKNPNLPDLSAREWQTQSVRIDIRTRFSQQDYQALGDWLAQYPDVVVIFEDGQFGDVLQMEERAWQAVEDGLLAFKNVAKLQLELSPLRDLEFLTRYTHLTDLDIHLSAACDLSALSQLQNLQHLTFHTSAGNLFEPDGLAAAPRLDLAALQGVKAKHVDIAFCRLLNAPNMLSVLQHCETLVFGFFFEEGTFEMPSLASFSSLRRLQFLPCSAQCLQNALDAPALSELIIYTDEGALSPSKERMAKAPALTHLTIMLQPNPMDDFHDAKDIAEELGKVPTQLEDW